MVVEGGIGWGGGGCRWRREGGGGGGRKCSFCPRSFSFS